jgi:hypothetical protein
MVMMAIVTTIMTSPVINWLYSKEYREQESDSDQALQEKLLNEDSNSKGYNELKIFGSKKGSYSFSVLISHESEVLSIISFFNSKKPDKFRDFSVLVVERKHSNDFFHLRKSILSASIGQVLDQSASTVSRMLQLILNGLGASVMFEALLSNDYSNVSEFCLLSEKSGVDLAIIPVESGSDNSVLVSSMKLSSSVPFGLYTSISSSGAVDRVGCFVCGGDNVDMLLDLLLFFDARGVVFYSTATAPLAQVEMKRVGSMQEVSGVDLLICFAAEGAIPPKGVSLLTVHNPTAPVRHKSEAHKLRPHIASSSRLSAYF